MSIEELYIKTERGAARHIPKCPTLVVRLEGTEEFPCVPLHPSPLYTVLDYGSVPELHLDEFLSPSIVRSDIFGKYYSEERARKNKEDVLERLEQHARGGNLFDVETARRMILDFERHYRSVDALLVHCAFGACRSPTYALAMNDLFDLGFDSIEIRQEYTLISWQMYRTIMDVGSTLVKRE